MAEDSVEEFQQLLTSVATEVSARLIQSLPTEVAECSTPQVGLLPEDFIDLARETRPRLIYWNEGHFDAADALEEALGVTTGADAMPEIRDHKPLKDFLRRWKRHDGERNVLLAKFMCDGVMHATMIDASWADAFEEGAQELSKSMKELAEGARKAPRSEVDPIVHERAVKLAEHPAFNAPRVSKDKRTYLAETIFPDLSSFERWQIVERATNVAWLRESVADEDFS